MDRIGQQTAAQLTWFVHELTGIVDWFVRVVTGERLAQVAMKKKKSLKSDKTRLPKSSRIPKVSEEQAFSEVATMIAAAKQQAYQAVNTTLIDLYWNVGKYLSQKLESAEWGDGVVDKLAKHLVRVQPGLRGFTRRSLFRMRQFFDTYQGNKKVSALLTQLPWTHHLMILGQCKRPEEREFYIKLSARERWSSRELERQLNGALFERAVLNPTKASAGLKKLHPEAEKIFKDAYLVEFLALPDRHLESDLHQSLMLNLRQFLAELGRDFCFVGSEVPLQVGGRDFALDLLFYHRSLNCLVAIELKIGEFKPEHLGKLNFYLEALDRDVRKPHENPSIGVLLCAGKDREVVEYALSRSLSPTLIAEYKTQLPDRKLLQDKLHEFYAQTEKSKLDKPNRKPKAKKKSVRKK